MKSFSLSRINFIASFRVKKILKRTRKNVEGEEQEKEEDKKSWREEETNWRKEIIGVIEETEKEAKSFIRGKWNKNRKKGEKWMQCESWRS